MNAEEFISLLEETALFPSDYASGYQRGLRRAYHGKTFGTAEEHAKFLAMREGARAAIGIGYVHGFSGATPLWRAEITTTESLRDLCDLVGGQSEAARLLDVANRTVRRWCSGQNFPDSDIVERIRAAVFDLRMH
jgi:hypothetical protein